MKMYAIMDINFKFFPKRGPYWVDDVDKAKFYDRLSTARNAVTTMALRSGVIHSIVVFDLYQSSILSEVDRVKGVIAKKEEKRVKQEIWDKEYKKQCLQRQIEEANRKLGDLLTPR